jgi:hypothetical protein
MGENGRMADGNCFFFSLVNDTGMAKVQPQNYGTYKLEMEKLGQPIRR